MAISTYTDLKTSIAGWLNRSDLTSIIPDFITLAEERINRSLRVRQMEVALAATDITDGAITIDDTTAAVKAIWVQGYETSPLAAQTYDMVLSLGSTGTPTVYAWQGTSLVFDGAGTVQGVLWQKVPSLSDSNPSTWLLAANPSAYLFGALSEAFHYTRNQAERDRWEGRFQQTLAEINGSDMRDRFSGPLQVRAR